MFRCATWFPSTAIAHEVEQHLLYPLSNAVTDESLATLFAELQVRNTPLTRVCRSSPSMICLNDTIRPANFDDPADPSAARRSAADDRLLLHRRRETARDAYSFLEMDDAVIAREAQKLGCRYAFVRNISDPVVRQQTPSGTRHLGGGARGLVGPDLQVLRSAHELQRRAGDLGDHRRRGQSPSTTRRRRNEVGAGNAIPSR